MSKKSTRNKDSVRQQKIDEIQEQLAKMRYYWIFVAIWFALGAFLTWYGIAHAQDIAPKYGNAQNMGIFIILLCFVAVSVGWKKRSNLLKLMPEQKKKAEPKKED